MWKSFSGVKPHCCVAVYLHKLMMVLLLFVRLQDEWYRFILNRAPSLEAKWKQSVAYFYVFELSMCWIYYVRRLIRSTVFDCLSYLCLGYITVHM